MKNIYKYQLEFYENQVIKIQSEKILSVIEQDNTIVVYATVDDELEANDFEFRILTTGESIKFELGDFNFLGTVKMSRSASVYHVFYRNNN